MAFLSRLSRSGSRSPGRGSREERSAQPILSILELERLLYTGKTACNHADEVWPGLYLGDQYVSGGGKHQRGGLRESGEQGSMGEGRVGNGPQGLEQPSEWEVSLPTAGNWN